MTGALAAVLTSPLDNILDKLLTQQIQSCQEQVSQFFDGLLRSAFKSVSECFGCAAWIGDVKLHMTDCSKPLPLVVWSNSELAQRQLALRAIMGQINDMMISVDISSGVKVVFQKAYYATECLCRHNLNTVGVRLPGSAVNSRLIELQLGRKSRGSQTCRTTKPITEY